MSLHASSRAIGRHVGMQSRDPTPGSLLEIKPTCLIMQPQRGQYNDVLANNTYLVAVVKETNYMTFGWWIS
jgi:hypothetical protein